jgi:hypothetical protein
LKDAVDILLYLYSVVMALALTTAVGMTVAPQDNALRIFDLSSQSLAIFGTFFITLVPFYHGASLHMLTTHRDSSAPRKRGEALVDFFALALEAVMFYAMAKSIGQSESFVLWFAALLLLDTGWVGFTYFKSQTDVGQAPKWWAFLNSAMLLILMLLWSPLRAQEPQAYALLFGASLVRTFLDYLKCYTYYFPEKKPDKP